MEVFQIVLTENRQRIFEVEADSLGDAVEKIARDYADSKIRLDEDYLKDFSIKAI